MEITSYNLHIDLFVRDFHSEVADLVLLFFSARAKWDLIRMLDGKNGKHVKYGCLNIHEGVNTSNMAA